MKKLIIILIIALFTSGCGMCNLDNFITPDDTEFLALVEELYYPEKITEYMRDNFEFEAHYFKTLSPYELYIYKKGDCNDSSNFVAFILNYHKYEVYQVYICFKGTFLSHVITVIKDEGKYNYSSSFDYFNVQVKTIKECVEDYIDYYSMNLKSFTIYDYNMNIIEILNK